MPENTLGMYGAHADKGEDYGSWRSWQDMCCNSWHAAEPYMRQDDV